jgi:hypothetical protein
MSHLSPSRLSAFLLLLCVLAGCGQSWTKHVGGTFEFHSPTVSIDDLPRDGKVKMDHCNLEYTISKAAAYIEQPDSVLVGFTVKVSNKVQRQEIERFVVDTVLADLEIYDAVVLSFD